MEKYSKWSRIFSKIKAFAKQTTIHGVPLIAAPRLHPFERLFWVVIVVSAVAGAISLSIKNVNRYYANPTVVSLQKDFRNWFNPFPSATACFVHKADEILIDEFIYTKWGLNDSHPRYDYYRDFALVVSNISYESMMDFERFKDDTELNSMDFLELAAKVHPELTGTLVTFDQSRKTDWTLVLTELGICFSVNIKFAKLFTFKVDGMNTTLDEDEDDSILKCHYLNGLCYARYDSDPLAPLKIYIHSYLDIAHATSGHPLHVKESEELEINYHMQETMAASSLRYLSPAQRQCRFDNEPINKDIPAYSTSMCYISCRYRLVMKLCGCKPFFYNNFPGKTCDIHGLLCIGKNAEHITKPPIKLGCKCPQPCDLITYLPQVPKITVWEYGYFDQRITFRWGLLPPTTKYHRDVLFGFEDLVVSIGGTLALFLGVSFISVTEITFFLIEFILLLICPKRKTGNVTPINKTPSNRDTVRNNQDKLKASHKNKNKKKSTINYGKLSLYPMYVGTGKWSKGSAIPYYN